MDGDLLRQYLAQKWECEQCGNRAYGPPVEIDGGYVQLCRECVRKRKKPG